MLVDKYNLDVGAPGDTLKEPGMCVGSPCRGSSDSAVGGKHAEAKKDHERGEFGELLAVLGLIP